METQSWRNEKKLMEKRVADLERRLMVESQREGSNTSSIGPMIEDLIKCANRVREDDNRIAQKLLDAQSLPLVLKYESPTTVIDTLAETNKSIMASEQELRHDVRELESVLATFYSTFIR